MIGNRQRLGLGAEYSVPMGPGNPSTYGGVTVTFKNPNGTYTAWGTVIDGKPNKTLPSDPNFVNPPDSVWQEIGVDSQAGLDWMANQLAWQKTQVQSPIVTTASLAEGVVPVNPYPDAANYGNIQSPVLETTTGGATTTPVEQVTGNSGTTLVSQISSIIPTGISDNLNTAVSSVTGTTTNLSGAEWALIIGGIGIVGYVLMKKSGGRYGR